MKRSIFIGSSSEGLPDARHLIELLNQGDNIECELWKSSFEPGLLTFEALEDMLLRNSAAVFVVTPDDSTIIRGQTVKIPRGNIMLEFGLVAGRLGRHNIALCIYGSAILPSDLTGMTVIYMDPDPAHNLSPEQVQSFRKEAEAKLQDWASHSLATANGIPRTELLHGYTGRWSFELRLQKWRGIEIGTNSFCQLNGWFDIFVNPDGASGEGFAHARMSFRLMEQPERPPFAGEILVSHQITNVYCTERGAIKFTSELLSLHTMTVSGTPWPELAGLNGYPEPWTFAWQLHPSGGPRQMKGTLKTAAGGGTEGAVVAVKTFAGAAVAASA